MQVVRCALFGRPLDTPKERLRWTVFLRHVPAGQARARRIPGIDQDNGHTRQLGLVFDKGPKLAECPNWSGEPSGEHRWGFGFFAYSSEKYELSIFPSGDFRGMPEDAFEVSANLYLR
jgi:hypothetical protein